MKLCDANNRKPEFHTTTSDSTLASEHDTKPKMPKISLEKQLHDFGEVAPKEKYTCEFSFRNIGTGLLKINRVISSCSCTVSELEQKDFAPGDSGVIKVAYESSAIEGPASRYLHISSNDPSNPKVQLRLKADIIPRVTVKPIEFKIDLKKKDYNIEPLVIESTDGNSFSIIEISSTNNAFDIDFDKSLKKTEYILQPRLKNALIKDSGNIAIQISHPKCKSIDIP